MSAVSHAFPLAQLGLVGIRTLGRVTCSEPPICIRCDIDQYVDLSHAAFCIYFELAQSLPRRDSVTCRSELVVAAARALTLQRISARSMCVYGNTKYANGVAQTYIDSVGKVYRTLLSLQQHVPQSGSRCRSTSVPSPKFIYLQACTSAATSSRATASL